MVEPGLLISPDAVTMSARNVLRTLDKSARSLRTYGAGNAVTSRFFEQLFGELTAHLESFGALAFTVHQSELRVGEDVVYGHDDNLGDNLAFRLHADGIREVAFHPGVAADEVSEFLAAVWGRASSEDEDDDVVTRLWTRDLQAITFVTAEQAVQAPIIASVLAPQEHGFYAPPPASFSGILDKERAAVANAPPGAQGGRVGGATGVMGYEVSDVELASLLEELGAETATDSVLFVLEMLKAILASESAEEVITKALGTLPGVFDVLMRQGRWSALVDLIDSLPGALEHNAGSQPYHRQMVDRVLASINHPERVRLLAPTLNAATDASLEPVKELLSRMSKAAVPGLCSVLAEVRQPDHRAILRDALVRLGAENPEPITRGLADPRGDYVRDLVAVIAAWHQAAGADVLAGLAAHPDARVRHDALTVISKLRPKGDGTGVVAFVADAERPNRMLALRLLTAGHFTAPWEAWRPQIEGEAFHEWPAGDKRATFHAIRVTCGDAAVPHWQGLLGDWGWKGRQKKEETALMAVEMLAALATPAALEALADGRERGNGAVRQACVTGLATAALRQRPPKES